MKDGKIKKKLGKTTGWNYPEPQRCAAPHNTLCVLMRTHQIAAVRVHPAVSPDFCRDYDP
jgi:hypothetical protein